MWILYTQLIILFLFNETTGENFFCTDAFFQNEWLGQATSTTINQVRREQETGWQNLKQSNLPKNKWGVCPCHNAAFTDDSEQWDPFNVGKPFNVLALRGDLASTSPYTMVLAKPHHQ